MLPSPLEFVESLRIGTVEYVSPEQIKVLLTIEAPESVSLNSGTARPFPRVNGYLLIPSDDGLLVGQVGWITVEQSPYPKRKGMQDFGLVDLPYPLRKLSLNPLGTLRIIGDDRSEGYTFRRGAQALPSVGDPVLIPTQRQLRSIVESGEDRRVKIGTSPLADSASVSIDPDRLFGRHLAILGNTGSGKSCSVAGLIRWCLEAVPESKPNARFIVLDPNGEYERAFGEEDGKLKPRVFKVDPDAESSQLRVPLWFWNSYEWSSFAQASSKAQRPLLRRALREVKAGQTGVLAASDEENKLRLRRYLTSKAISIRRELKTGSIQTAASKFGFRLKAVNDDLESKEEDFPDLKDKLEGITESIEAALQANFNSFTDKESGELVEYYRAFTEEQVEAVLAHMDELLGDLGGITYPEGPSEDVPVRYLGSDLADHLQILGEEEGVSQFLDFLIMRIRTILSDTRIQPVFAESDDLSLEEWLNDYVGANEAKNGCLAIIDLSLVPSEVIHIVTAVAARMVFEALQRYRKLNEDHKVLPTVIVMEEAHTFINRYRANAEIEDVSTICTRVFERIAREGRKFGLGLVLASQRPSELSPTVLSQCNSFLLHRISNDRDQDLVNRYVPDNLRGLLRELPSLPSQSAILLGWASELPVLVRMNDLPKKHQPQSDDPDFWAVWSGEDERDVQWKEIAGNWQGVGE